VPVNSEQLETFETAIARVEMRSQRIISVLLIVTLIFINIVFHTQLQHLSLTFRYAVAGMSLFLVVWFLLLALVIKYGHYHHYVKFLNVIIQVSTVTLFLLVSASLVGVTFALTSAAPFFYLLIIGISSLTFNPKVAIIAAGFAAGQYVGVYAFWLQDLVKPEDYAIYNTGWPAILIRSMIFIVMGTAAMLIAMQARRLLIRAVEQARQEVRIQHMEEDMMLAAEIQSRLIPEKLDSDEHYEMTSFYRPADAVGGDYFDVIPVGNGSHYAFMADVSGKGYAAAMMMANLQSIIRLMVQEGRDLRDMMRVLNQAVLHASARGRFVTLVGMHLDKNHDELQYVNCGHNPPLICEGGTGNVIEFSQADPVLGVIENYPFQMHSMPFKPGSALFAYTDGLSEANGMDGTQFKSVLDQILCDHCGKSPERLKQYILDALSRHIGEKTMRDDMSFFFVCRKPL